MPWALKLPAHTPAKAIVIAKFIFFITMYFVAKNFRCQVGERLF
jgi:hypothetical protein